jgi:glycerol-3-phosphate dehydrogenase subunit C
MPQFEQGKVKETVQQAVKVTEVLSKYIDEGYDVVAPVASCALMLKKEWPLLMPDNPVRSTKSRMHKHIYLMFS